MSSSQLPVLSKELESIYAEITVSAYSASPTPARKTHLDEAAEKLTGIQQDFLEMWLSEKYPDVHLSIGKAGPFPCHLFILSCRCPAFLQLLPQPESPAQLLAGTPLVPLNLPSPPFTPEALYFVFGYLYAGTLKFSSKPLDLETAFSIARVANRLHMQALYDEIESRLVEEFAHGLFHACVSEQEYEQLVPREWYGAGCKCKTCAGHIPLIHQFAEDMGLGSSVLLRGSRRGLEGIFGEGWFTTQFSTLPPTVILNARRSLENKTSAFNVLRILFASQRATRAYASQVAQQDSIDARFALGRTNVGFVFLEILAMQGHVDRWLTDNLAACFRQPEWARLLQTTEDASEDRKKVDWVLQSIFRGLSINNAPVVYQVRLCLLISISMV